MARSYSQLRTLALEITKRPGLMREIGIQVCASVFANEVAPDQTQKFLAAAKSGIESLFEVIDMMEPGSGRAILSVDTKAAIAAEPGYDASLGADTKRFTQKIQVHSENVATGRPVDKITFLDDVVAIDEFRIRWADHIVWLFAIADRWEGQDAPVGRRVADASRAIDDLTHLTRSIDLVAVNATIEASRFSGDSGGFRVLAEEMRRLSGQAGNILQSAQRALTTGRAVD